LGGEAESYAALGNSKSMSAEVSYKIWVDKDRLYCGLNDKEALANTVLTVLYREENIEYFL
jgi:hypothetical protein